MNDTDLLLYVAQKHTQLKLIGNKYVGLCPLHGEKTPSFYIYTESGKWRCFGGCGGGDAIDLHRAITGDSYIEAKKALPGLWDDSRPQPRPRPPQPPREYTSTDRAECYRIARATLVRMRDCKITHQGNTQENGDAQENGDFILSAIEGHQDRDGFIERICSDIGGKNWEHQTAASIEIFTTLFLTQAYPVIICK